MTGSRVAIRSLVAAFGIALAVPAAVSAQQAPRSLNLSAEERSALAALQAAAGGADRVAQDAALAAARAAARGADARYAVANYHLQLGQARADAQMVSQAVDDLVASGIPQGAELVPLLAHQATRIFSSGDVRATDRMLARMSELQPNNATVLADHAQIKARLGDRAAAVSLMQRAIAALQAAGQAVPESWFLRALALAFDGGMAQPTAEFAHGLVAAYPSPRNWRDALLSYRQVNASDPTLALDIARLRRAAQGLTGERDYLEAAQALNTAGLPGEAKAVLDEGVQRGMLSATEPRVRDLLAATTPRAARGRAALAGARTRALAAATAQDALAAGDAHFGYGQFAEAAELYGAALQKGGDAGLVNLRLGASLAMAGRRPEAEAALRAVAGPRADLAGFWLAWLARRTA